MAGWDNHPTSPAKAQIWLLLPPTRSREGSPCRSCSPFPKWLPLFASTAIQSFHFTAISGGNGQLKTIFQYIPERNRLNSDSHFRGKELILKRSKQFHFKEGHFISERPKHLVSQFPKHFFLKTPLSKQHLRL